MQRPARLSQELALFDKFEAQDNSRFAQEAAAMVKQHQKGSKCMAAAPAPSNKAKKMRRDDSEEVEDPLTDLSAKELEKIRVDGHKVVQEAMRTEGLVEKWRWQHRKVSS
ncbi:hypothetical protein BDQ12DRAFT_725820 [Crucibulum laeve]|uniref:Uncharacterized protein n=1 Tax=Crucibulum laeve TaxID=68775 RepID=A0A5C3LRY3_9AGAR|nr:hypothetical protein BDQ12DRAFT_725820 [Crucibulum laeve]